MKLKHLEIINQLLEERIYLIACLDQLKVNGLDCISMNISENLKCKAKIIKKLKGVNKQVAIIVYDEMVTELRVVEEKLLGLAVDIELRQYLSGDKQSTAEALTDEIPAVFDPAPVKSCVIGRPWPEGEFLDPNVKYSE